MDPQILHDNKKLLDDDEPLLIIDRISSSDVPTLPQTFQQEVNSSNNKKNYVIDFISSLINSILSIALKEVKQMCIAENSSSHITYTYNEDFSRLPIDHVPFICAKKDNGALSITFPDPDNNELHMRKKIVQCLSSSVLSTNLFLGISCNIWSSILSLIHVPPLHKEWDDHLSIWLSMFGLFGFMVFVCAVVVMILVRAPFTCMQKAMLVFWVILLHLQSVNSVSDVFVTLVGALLMVWYVFGNKARRYEEVI